MKTFTLNASYLTLASSVALPLITAFVTKQSAHGRVKAATLVVLSILSALAQTLIAKHGVIVWHTLTDNTITTFVLAYVAHAGLLKPAGASDAVASVAPTAGLGAAQDNSPQPVEVPTTDSSQPVFAAAEATYSDGTPAPPMDAMLIDLAQRLDRT